MSDKIMGTGTAVFGIRDFSLYLASRFLWGMGQHVQTIAIAWTIYEITRDPLTLGLIGLATFIPAVPLSLIAGPVADRYDRRSIIIACSIIMALSSLCAIAMMSFGIIHQARIWPLYVVVFIFGACRSFSGPAGQAFVMSLIPSEQFTTAASWNNTINQSATIIGPSLGGLLFPLGSIVPFTVAFLMLSASALFATLITARMAKSNKPSINLKMLLAGYAFIGRAPVILGAITLDLAAVLFAGATALLPIFARDIFESGPWGLGLLRSMPSVGSLCAAVLLAYLPLRWHIGRTMFLSVAAYGLATICFGLSNNIFIGMVCLAILGAADMISLTIRQTLIQVETPDDMRGRVSAVHSILTGTSNHLGDFESGMLAHFIGAVPTVILGGSIAVAASIVWSRLFPPLAQRQKF